MSSRKAPFTSFEREYLKEILIPYINVLESKRTDTDFKNKKSKLWDKVTEMFNSSPKVQQATSQQLKKLWLNMKARARDAKSLEKQRSHTGGGPYVPDMDPDHESVLSMVPHLMPTINVEKDSDGVGESVTGDDDSFAWKPKKKRRVSPDHIEDYFPDTTDEVIVMSVAEDHCYENVTIITSSVTWPATTSTITRPPTTSPITIPTTSTITIPTTSIITLPTTSIITIPTTPSITCPATSTITRSVDTKTVAASPTSKKQTKSFNKPPSIDSLRIKLIENDITQRKIKFEKEIEQLEQTIKNEQKMFDLKHKILLLEYEHKKAFFEIELQKGQK